MTMHFTNPAKLVKDKQYEAAMQELAKIQQVINSVSDEHQNEDSVSTLVTALEYHSDFLFDEFADEEQALLELQGAIAVLESQSSPPTKRLVELWIKLARRYEIILKDRSALNCYYKAISLVEDKQNNLDQSLALPAVREILQHQKLSNNERLRLLEKIFVSRLNTLGPEHQITYNAAWKCLETGMTLNQKEFAKPYARFCIDSALSNEYEPSLRVVETLFALIDWAFENEGVEQAQKLATRLLYLCKNLLHKSPTERVYLEMHTRAMHKLAAIKLLGGNASLAMMLCKRASQDCEQS